jgi:hypothetical protein
MYNRVEVLTIWTNLLGPRQEAAAIEYMASEIFGDVSETLLNEAVTYSIKNETMAVPSQLRQLIDSGMFGEVEKQTEKIVVVRTWRDVVDQEINDMAFDSRSEMIDHLQYEQDEGQAALELVDPQTSESFDVLSRLIEDAES